MSDSDKALIPVSNKSIVPYSPQVLIQEEEASSRRIRRRQRIPLPPSPRVELALFVRCVTNQPVTFFFSSRRGTIMDRNNFNPYNGYQSGYPTGGSQGQGAFPQQQFPPQNQNQYPPGQGQGGNPHVNHYHGSQFNFTFSNSGAYDLNIRIPGLIGGPNPGMPFNQPQQSINSAPNQGGMGYGNNTNGMGYGHHQHINMNQQTQQPSDGFNRQGSQGPIVLPDAGQAFFNNRGPDLPGHGYSTRNSLRRTYSTNTLLSGEFPEDCCFGSQTSNKRA